MSQGHRNQISDTNVQSSDAVALKNALQAIVDEFGVDKSDIGKLLQGISAGQKVVDDIQQPREYTVILYSSLLRTTNTVRQ